MAELASTFVTTTNRLIRSKGWTRTELASRMGVPLPHVSRWLSGRHQPRLNTVELFAKALGVKPDSLLR